MSGLAEWHAIEKVALAVGLVLVALPFIVRNLGRGVGEVRCPLEGAALGWTVGFHVRRHEGSIPETATIEVQARVRLHPDETVFLSPGEARELAAYLRTAARTKVDA